MRGSPRSLAGLLAVTALLAVAAACGDDGDRVGDERADQARAAALEAGLSEEVADVLALAARGATATFQVTYRGTEGTRLVISQKPPNRRVDVVDAGLVVESQVVRDRVGYACSVPEGAPRTQLECRRTQGALEQAGVFRADAIEDFTQQLVDTAGEFDLTVEDRAVAGADATCLVATARTRGEVDTICLSPEGAQLLVDVGGDRLEAEAYTTEVPDGTFEV